MTDEWISILTSTEGYGYGLLGPQWWAFDRCFPPAERYAGMRGDYDFPLAVLFVRAIEQAGDLP